MSTYPSDSSSRIRIGLVAIGIAAGLAVSACDSDPTPIRDSDTPVTSLSSRPSSLQLAGRDLDQAGLSAAARGSDLDAAGEYRLSSNDRLRIIVFGQEKLTGEYVLDGSGALAFPLIGSIPANGLTSKDLERELSAKLEPDYVRNVSVSVEVLSRRPFYVVGEVQKAGSYPHASNLNVLTAVAIAGGYTYRARKSALFLKRVDKDGKIYRVRATPETMVRPGDVVEVNERYF